MVAAKLIKINNINNQINPLDAINGEFINNLQLSEKDDVFANDLIVDNGTLSVDLLGYTISGRQRMVRVQEDVFLFEYHFSAEWNEEKIPIWTFYLMPTGTIKTAPDEDLSNGLCGHNNRDIKNILLSQLHTEILKTKLFDPTVKLSALSRSDLQ